MRKTSHEIRTASRAVSQAASSHEPQGDRAGVDEALRTLGGLDIYNTPGGSSRRIQRISDPLQSRSPGFSRTTSSSPHPGVFRDPCCAALHDQQKWGRIIVSAPLRQKRRRSPSLLAPTTSRRHDAFAALCCRSSRHQPHVLCPGWANTSCHWKRARRDDRKSAENAKRSAEIQTSRSAREP